LLRLEPQFDRWQRIVRPLELLALRPVMKAVVAHQQRMTLNTLSLVRFPPLRALLSSTGIAPWGKELPCDPESRTRPLLPPFKPDAVVREATREAATMGEATPSDMRRRLGEIYARPDVCARIADSAEGSSRVDMHLARTIWMVVPALRREPDPQPMPLVASL
jgi:hypothetical protein